MSESQRLGRLDWLRSAVTGKGPQLMDQYAKQGLKVLLFPGFFMRNEILLRQRMILENRMLDMVDRVHEADTLLYVVGLLYARGGEKTSAAWNLSWEYWRAELNSFDDHALQREWYRAETLIEIEESVPTVDASPQEDGTTKVMTKYIRTTRQVRQETFDAFRVVDAHMLQSKDKPEGWEPMEFVARTTTPIAEGVEDLKRLTGYDPVAAEESIRLWGNEMLMWAGVVLNRAVRDKDVPSQTGDIIYMSQNPNLQNKMEYPSQSVTGSSAQTGVHK